MYVFVPFATDTWYAGNFFGPVFQYTDQVSLSFYVFGCGVVHGGYYTVNGQLTHYSSTLNGWYCR
jgi:hypothetical protein